MSAPITEAELEELRVFADALMKNPDSTGEEVAGGTIGQLLDEIERLRGRVLAWRAAATTWRKGSRAARNRLDEVRLLLGKHLLAAGEQSRATDQALQLLQRTLYQDGRCQHCDAHSTDPHEIDCEAAQVLGLAREDSPADAVLPVEDDEPEELFEIDETEHERGVGCWCDPACRPPCTTCGGLVHEQPVYDGFSYVCEPVPEGSR